MVLSDARTRLKSSSLCLVLGLILYYPFEVNMGMPSIIFPYSFRTNSRAGPLELDARSNRDLPDISISLLSVALS